MALASGLGVIPGYEANVLLADSPADQAMFNHVREHRARNPGDV